MTEKVKIITPESNLSLEELDITPGDFVGFDNRHANPLQPFIFAIVGKGGLSKSSNSRWLELIHFVSEKEEKFYLDLQGGSYLNLFSPYYLNGEERFRMFNQQEVSTFDGEKKYTVEYAYVGGRMVVGGLRERESIGLDIYANWLESERARSEKLGKITGW